MTILAFWPIKLKYYLWLTDWSAIYVESHGAGIILSLSFFTSLQNKTVLIEEIKNMHIHVYQFDSYMVTFTIDIDPFRLTLQLLSPSH